MKREIRLLIVDDNEPTRYALRRRMERHGYHVLEAATGAHGLELIEAEAIDALILDVNLPDMNGYDIVRTLRSHARTALLPIIHFSAASVHTQDIVGGLDAGADAYLVHPVDTGVLVATLRTLLRVRDTEHALRESEARFREIFVNVPAAIAVLDAELNVHECNHAFTHLIGGNVARLASHECFVDGQSSVISELRLNLAAGERWKGTLSLDVQGEILETEWQLSPYYTPLLSLVFVEDITEHRRRERSHLALLDNATTQLAKEVAERARREAQLLQAQKMDALGKLTGGIAHDFNNLLTGIITSLELIQQRVVDGRTQKIPLYTEAALHSATSAATLTNRLLAFARQQPLDSRPVDINHHVRSLEELLVRTIGERIFLKLELANKPAIAMADPIQLESALLNLVINARDALPQGGNVWIRTYAASLHGDPNLADGAYFALSVRDDGVGIEGNVIQKVFDPFFTTKPMGEGTGLGLSTIYGMVRQSGGDVNIRSAPGNGTEVTIFLPASDAPVSAAALSHPDEIRGNGEHILIVDDVPSVRMFVTEALEEAGYRCTQVSDVEGALDRLEHDQTIDLLLTDVGLPVMSGRELANLARGWNERLPVLFMTGYAETATDRQAFLGDGMDMLIKPFRINELLYKVHQVMESPDF
jgi:PAS domain S-box-containing protein